MPVEARIVGTHYRGSRTKEIVSLFEVGTEVELEREPENEYDLFAIKVMFGGEHIGYVNRDVSAWIAPEIDDRIEIGEELDPAEVVAFEEGNHVTYPVISIPID